MTSLIVVTFCQGVVVVSGAGFGVLPISVFPVLTDCSVVIEGCTDTGSGGALFPAITESREVSRVLVPESFPFELGVFISNVLI